MPKPPIIRLVLTVLGMALGTMCSQAQSGLTLSEIKEKLSKYFADELLADIDKILPRGTQYRIWGWDVGDFTGDGYNDVALSVYNAGARKKECTVHMIADIDGFLTDVATFSVPFVDLPLEVGVVVKDTTCFIAQKRKADDWGMKGYRFVAGSVVLVDEFTTNKVAGLAHESYRNYVNLNTHEEFSNDKGTILFESQYLTIPCYERGRQLFAGIYSEATPSSIRNVLEGAYWWKGPDDASFSARLVYDADYLYVRINVLDSTIVTGWCDTCIADRLELWFEVNDRDDAEYSRTIKRVSRRGVTPRNEIDSGLYAIAVRIGNFEDIPPTVKVITTDDLDTVQQEALDKTRAVTGQHTDGYVVKLRIPMELLGFARTPVGDDQVTEYGCTIALYDVDNEFRPEETTIVATSHLSRFDPSSYGSIRFIPAKRWYGETTNIFTDAVLSSLRELGF